MLPTVAVEAGCVNGADTLRTLTQHSRGQGRVGTGGGRRGRRSAILCLHGEAFSAVSGRGTFKRTIREGGDMRGRGGAGSRRRDGRFANRNGGR